jgi:hypothetical protein
MKNNILIFAFSAFFNLCVLSAQETPKPQTPPAPPTTNPTAPNPPSPPATMPTPPERPEQLGTVVPSESPLPGSKTDTTIISVGDRQIIIIENKDTKAKGKKAEWEEDLDESMEDLKESLKDVKAELEESKLEMENSKEEMEKESNENDHHENQAPDGNKKYKFKLKKDKSNNKHKAADIDFLDFDFGVNLLNMGNSISEQMQKDLGLKTWGSWSYTFTFFPTKIFLGSQNLMLMTGLSWRIGQLEFKEKIDFEPNKTLVYVKDENLKKTQFMIHHLQIPLSIYWKSKRIKGLGDLGLGIGTYAGILLSEELETETANPDRDIETNEDFGFEDFRYGLSARVDIGALKLFANMDLNNLWKDNDIKNIECGIWIDF